MRLKDKVCIVTGAARGIGEATAILFAREGGKVVVADMRKDEGEDVVRGIREEGNEAIFAWVDIKDENQVIQHGRDDRQRLWDCGRARQQRWHVCHQPLTRYHQ